jgi:uncharacterized protein (TIGR03492 family)
VTRLLVISNGIGEDSVGAEIVRRLPPGFSVEAYPTLGDGRFYNGVCPIVGPRAHLPSQGSRVDRGTLMRDVGGGLLSTIGPGLAFLRRARNEYDRVLVIGDFIGVGACWLAGVRDVVYVDVYKTGYGRRYSFAEKQIIRRTCRTAFCRSAKLADSLTAMGVDARAAGNVMMDTIPYGDYNASQRRLRLKAVTLLPGSREATADNFALQVEAISLLPEELRPDVFVAVADGIVPEHLGKAAGMFFHPPAGRESSDVGRLSGRGLHINLARSALGALVEASDLVLSQAGTATIQSLGLGKPVITFVRNTDRAKRFVEENRLFGEARLTVPAEVPALVDAMSRLLGDKAELARLGAIGKERIGGPGAIREIVAALGGSPAPASEALAAES